MDAAFLKILFQFFIFLTFLFLVIFIILANMPPRDFKEIKYPRLIKVFGIICTLMLSISAIMVIAYAMDTRNYRSCVRVLFMIAAALIQMYMIHKYRIDVMSTELLSHLVLPLWGFGVLLFLFLFTRIRCRGKVIVHSSD